MSAADLSLITCTNETTTGGLVPHAAATNMSHGAGAFANLSTNGSATVSGGGVALMGEGVFGMSTYWELVFSFFLYAYSIWRIWTLEVRFNASLDGGEDIIGRIGTGLQIVMIGGIAVSITADGIAMTYGTKRRIKQPGREEGVCAWGCWDVFGLFWGG